jgi:hypothetical protein
MRLQAHSNLELLPRLSTCLFQLTAYSKLGKVPSSSKRLLVKHAKYLCLMLSMLYQRALSACVALENYYSPKCSRVLTWRLHRSRVLVYATECVGMNTSEEMETLLQGSSEPCSLSRNELSSELGVATEKSTFKWEARTADSQTRSAEVSRHPGRLQT